MPYAVNDLSVRANTAAEQAAARILCDALRERLGAAFTGAGAFRITLCEEPAIGDPDRFNAALGPGGLTLRAQGLRGLIYGVGLFLRKLERRNGGAVLICDISGEHAPQKAVRGHQLGYRPCANTYDAWDPAAFRRYSLELMFFGANTVEHIPPLGGERNALMAADEQTLLSAVSADAHALGLNVSLWYPNGELPPGEELAARERVFARTPYVDDLFIPGGDPGSLSPAELFARAERYAAALRELHPGARVWLSAQAPHGSPGWGEAFLAETEKRPAFLSGVITGPNRAFPLETLRRRLPAEYPIRFYPDITHNLRCEHPVHFEQDDWHVAFCTALSRECVNPRPEEYARLHGLTAPYTVGSVSYSEGVNDDVNKAVWSALDWNADTPVREILEDWARLFFFGCDPARVADAVEALEKNWSGDPENEPCIDAALALWESLESDATRGNWRFRQGLFRARCDKYIREKLRFENGLLAEARPLLKAGRLSEAEARLRTPRPAALDALRAKIGADADALFRLIGMQLSVEKHGASGWERGATLDTLDLPVTDLPRCLSLLGRAESARDLARREAACTETLPDEWYFSFALQPLSALGAAQTPDYYMNVLGDRPNRNDGTLPVRLMKLFDHTSLRLTRGGFLPGRDYTLVVTYKDPPASGGLRHTVTANGHTVYDGPPYGGKRNEAVSRLLPAGFTAVEYELPAAVFRNGVLRLEIAEPTVGFEAAELRILRRAIPSERGEPDQ